MADETWRFESGIRPEHLTQGLGAAERELLCTCLALFDDSTYLVRLSGCVQKGKGIDDFFRQFFTQGRPKKK